ncbi:MAG: iron-sulfur protein, partial [Firmicutes bacterium]|nr:iron-sulfur protein [Bacillota bacterium]
YNTVKPNFKKRNVLVKSGPIQRFVFSLVTSRPKILRKCKGCKICFEHCPPKAIAMTKNKAKINYEACIRCFCCHELCPHKKIKIKKPIIYRMFRFK